MITAVVLGALVLTSPPTGPVQDFSVQRNAAGYQLKFDGRTVRTSNSAIAKLRTLRLGGTQQVATWTEQGRPFFAISTDGVDVQRVSEASTTIDLWYQSFDPAKSRPAVPSILEAPPTNEIYIVQFATQPLEQYVRDIEAAGGKVYNYCANQAYLVQLDDNAKARVAQLPYVRWIGAYQPAYRLDPSLVNGLVAGSLPQRDVYNMLLFENGGVQKVPVSERIRNLGGVVIDDAPYGHMLVANLTPDQLRQAAGWNEVMWIDRWPGPLEPDMDIVRQFSGANYINTVGNYRGQGVRGQVRDTAVRQTHVDFASRPLIIRANTGDSTHGTSTTGIIFGDGTGNPMGKGLLPAGQGIFLSNLGTNGFPTTGAARFADTQPLISSPYFAVFESNSTGSPQTTQYTSESANMDDIIFQLDLLITQSQSNLSNQNSRPQAWAKNMVSVGGITHRNTLTRTDDIWDIASIGPASDGRIKPDLAHFDDSIFCPTNTSDTAYTSSFNGTSSATPITTGHFGLLFQMWADGIFGQTVTGTTVFDSKPHQATAKAIAINQATQYPFSGTGANLTRVHQGWGTIQVDNMYNNRNKMFIIDQSDVLTPLATNTYRLYVTTGEPTFLTTMVYKDPMGNPANQSQHRINNLDLKVTAPDGTIYWGNNGLLAGNWSTSGGSPNTKDTVENVFVQNPLSGVWTVQVIGTEIVQDSHLETGALDADYALVASGVTSRLTLGNFNLERGIVLSGTTGDLVTSNNVRYNVRPGVVLSSGEAPVRLMAEATSPTTSLTQIKVRLEGFANQANIGQTLELYNWTSSAYDVINTQAATTSDSAVNVTVNNPANYVNGSGTIRVRASYKPTGPILNYPWNVGMDQLQVAITP